MELAQNLEYLEIHAQGNESQPMAAAAEAISYFPNLKKLVLLLNSFPDCGSGLLDANPLLLRHKIIRLHLSAVEKATGFKLKEEPMEGFDRRFVWQRE
jgi:hypothetical protein